MRTALASLFLLAACGGASSTSPDPVANEPPAGGRLAAPPPADPSALCDVFTTITFDVVYDGACSGPASLSLDYNPTAEKQIDLTEGTADPADVIVSAEQFSAQGCTGTIGYTIAGGMLDFEFYATGAGEVAGTGTWREETGTECPARLTGTWKTWTDQP
jgi:hypothetical protein